MSTILESKRELSVVRECDVLVAGGGIAGIAAALAVARNGAKTVLVTGARRVLPIRYPLERCTVTRLKI